MKKVIIADDHSIIRQGIKKIISESACYSVVGEAASVFELKNVLKEQHADVLILDLSMPGGAGIETLKEIKGDYPKLPVLILSFHGENQYGLRAFKAGAAGYLTKECTPEQLLEALKKIITGKRYFSNITLNMIFDELENKKNSISPHQNLSDREFHVFSMLGHGVKVTEISKDLSLSVKTVSTYRQRVLNKMHMTTNAEMVKYFIFHEDEFNKY